MPRQRSDLYQVDFMAALFGGFVLVWLSGQGTSESRQTGPQAPILFSLSARLIYPSFNGSEPSISVLPEEAVDAPCIPIVWLGPMFGSHPHPTSCHGTAAEKAFDPHPDTAVENFVNKDGLAHDFVRVAGIDMKLSGDQNNIISFPTIVGRVINSIQSPVTPVQRGTEGEVAYIDRDLEQSLIAIVPAGWTKTPNFVVRNATSVNKLVYSETAKGQGLIEYKVDLRNEKIRMSHGNDLDIANRLEVLVHWDLAGQNTCYRKTIILSENTGAERSFGLQPCASVDVETGSR